MSLAQNTIHQTDCLKGLEQLTPGSVDLAFADPPFNIGYKYDEYDDEQDHDAYLGWSRKWISGVHRALKPTGTFWLAIGDEYAAELKLRSQEVGFSCRSWVVWYYTFGVNCVRKFTRSHVHLFYFVKDRKNFTFNENDLTVRVPSARQLVYNDSRGNPFGRLPDDTWVLRPQDLVDGFSPDEDTWYIPRVNGTFKERAGFHGCQMPEQLLGRIIRSCSNQGELILDPFSGSATTLAVAKKLNRRWIGFELSKEYARRGTARLDGIQCGDKLEGADEPRVSAPATPKEPRKGRVKNGKGQAKLALGDVTHAEKSEDAFDFGRFERGLIEVFQHTNEGFSVDRLVADPNLNNAFLDKCRELGIPGDATQINRAIFRLRKSGKLAKFATTRRTEFTWQHVDQYIFASEIAWRKMLDRGAGSLDAVFCNPDLAREFDRIAHSLAPGFSALEYRWAALKLRKESHNNRNRADELNVRVTGDVIALKDAQFEPLAKIPGIYLVSHEGNPPVFIGESLNLGARLNLMFGCPERIRLWQEHVPSVHLKLLPRDESASPFDLMARQFRLIRRYNPALNQAIPA